MKVENVNVYGLENSFRVSKFPMATDTSKLNDEYTTRIKSLGTSNKGEGHDNFLCGIVVQFDLTFSNKAWVEAERYHFFDIVSSQSTMHRIAKFDLDKVYNNYVDKDIIEIMKDLVSKYQHEPTPENYLKLLYSNPSGFELTAGITTNYRQLKTIYAQRKNHRLPEWRDFCSWVETLPYSELITGDFGNESN